MAAIPHRGPVPSPVHVTPTEPMHPPGHPAPALPGVDPTLVINAEEQRLAEYLNQPVQDIMARLGLPPLPDAATQTKPPTTDAAAGAAHPDGAPLPGPPRGRGVQ